MLELFPSDEWEHARMVLASVLQAVICQRLVRGLEVGLVPAVEVMLNTPVIKHILEQNKMEQLAEAIQSGNVDGMQSFNQSIHQLISSRKISEEEGLKFATNVGALRMALGGISTGNRRILSR
jgi:Tfp pilus assembly pilus retraction ATPase PilT